MSKKIKDKSDINTIVKNSIKNAIIEPQNSNRFNSKFKTKEAYEKSFDDILNFKSKYKGPMDFDIVYYHETKMDGLAGASSYYLYLNGKSNSVNMQKHRFIALRASKGMFGRFIRPDDVRDKNVLIIDLDIQDSDIKQIITTSKNVLIIDDHERQTNVKQTDNLFIGANHSACAYTWKFFFPDKPVPNMVQIIDSQDRKLNLPWFGFASNFIQSALTFEFAQNVKMRHKFRTGEIVKIFADVIKEDNTVYYATIGRYMDMAIEYLKEQIAETYTIDNFLGYRVGVLNFMSQLLPVRVARQIISNAEARGDKIDFVVLYSYQRGKKAYQVRLVEKHEGQAKYDLPKMATELGKMGGVPEGGGGSRYIGNFYWGKTDKKDIWDLFEAKSMTDLKNRIK